MFKKDKTQKTSKGRWKWVFAVLAILILVAAGVVLGITYWPHLHRGFRVRHG